MHISLMHGCPYCVAGTATSLPRPAKQTPSSQTGSSTGGSHAQQAAGSREELDTRAPLAALERHSIGLHLHLTYDPSCMHNTLPFTSPYMPFVHLSTPSMNPYISYMPACWPLPLHSLFTQARDELYIQKKHTQNQKEVLEVVLGGRALGGSGIVHACWYRRRW